MRALASVSEAHEHETSTHPLSKSSEKTEEKEKDNFSPPQRSNYSITNQASVF